MNETLLAGSRVRHFNHGLGTVRADLGSTAIINFDKAGLQECVKSDLEILPAILEKLREPTWDVPLEVINRIQAELIKSINDVWGVFARSRIALLPHQLWVCREVSKEWPTRWLIADDVGLGKTIEAGMILTPLISGDRVKRLLILCPASIVEQWQQRLREMFDIRMAIYTPTADTARTDFWGTHNQVVVSFHTLRADHKGRHERLLESELWDLVIVDESHHLNADEQKGPTLAYQLVKKLEENKKVLSMLFFTGTPHRGKTFGFLAQLHLLRENLFDPRKPLEEQLPHLCTTIIRNNKYNVTDLKGKRLFQEPKVSTETYSYSEQEQSFYNLLTEFILRGRAYASGLSKTEASAVILVLITMQKLASSSVAAVRRAIRGRLERISKQQDVLEDLNKKLAQYQSSFAEDAGDKAAALEEEIAAIGSSLKLTEEEESALRELLDSANAVKTETKIDRILQIIEERFEKKTVLLFTEYKATQSLLMSKLIRQYGPDCVTFINGDERAEDIEWLDGSRKAISKLRSDAAAEFNKGRKRFLISTEAAAEGIDLQENCHCLIHVDLPWNPMRLHQRVGRLNRYGQQHKVEIVSIRNPDTVESLIWEKLDEKLERINEAFAHVMETPEDLKQLILGTASPTIFQGLFAGAIDKQGNELSKWFDQETRTLGGEDVVDVVKALIGKVNKFDFQQISPQLPQVDLPDLKPFFESALMLNRRQVTDNDGSISFITPDDWRIDSPVILPRYENMVFKREIGSEGSSKRLLGIGHKVFDIALNLARARETTVASLPSHILDFPLFVYKIYDRLTDKPSKPVTYIGVKMKDNPEIISDWNLLKWLNELPIRRNFMREPSARIVANESFEELIRDGDSFIVKHISELGKDYRMPYYEIVACLIPRFE